MKRNNYNAPEFELIKVEATDIITTSPNGLPFVGEDDELDINGGNL